MFRLRLPCSVIIALLFAVCAHAQGRDELAARLFGVADLVASRHRVAIWPPPEEHDYRTQVEETRESLGTAEFTRLTIEGESLDIDAVVGLVEEAGA